MASDRGFWNRAGRRSGGDRPTVIAVPTVVRCTCGAVTPFWRLPRYVLYGAEVAKCPACGGILAAMEGGRWVTANEMASTEDA